MKAFIFDPLWDELVTDALLARLQAAGIELVVTKEVAPLSECNELFEGDEARILCVNPDYVGWKLSAGDYQDIPHLTAILVASTAFEWVERDIADERGIPICNIVGFSTQAVAEWAVMMMFNLARQTPRLIKDNYPLDFDKDFMKYRGIQLQSKTVGIIGLGHIGGAIAEACRGLGMEVVYYSRTTSSNQSYRQVSLETLFETADVIFPTLPKNAETSSLISKDHLASVKSSAILVDITHGLFSQEQALEMVTAGKLFGYGFEGKPNEFNSFSGNVWAAPAYAWTTAESMNNSVALWVENMISAAAGEFPMRVN